MKFSKEILILKNKIIAKKVIPVVIFYAIVCVNVCVKNNLNVCYL